MREGEGAILEVKVSEMEKEPFGPEKEDRRGGGGGKAAHPSAWLYSSVWWGPGSAPPPFPLQCLVVSILLQSPPCIGTLLQDRPHLRLPEACALTFLFNLQLLLPFPLQTPFPCYLRKRERERKQTQSSEVSSLPLGPLPAEHVCIPMVNCNSLPLPETAQYLT